MTNWIPMVEKTPNPKYPDESPHEFVRFRNGYNITSRGMQGPKNMAFNDYDEIEATRLRILTIRYCCSRKVLSKYKQRQLLQQKAESPKARGLELGRRIKPFSLTNYFTLHLPDLVKLDEFDAMDADGDGVVPSEENEAAQAVKSDENLEEE